MKTFFNVVVIALSLCLFGCKIAKQKELTKTEAVEKKDVETKATKTTTEKLDGGNINTFIKPESERPRDIDGKLLDFIETYKDGGLTKTIHYKPDGSVHTTCNVEDIIKVIREEFTKIDNTTSNIQHKESKKDKEEGIDPTIFLYFMIGVVVVLVVALLLFNAQITKNTKAVRTVLNRL